jgi:hypothetical protein
MTREPIPSKPADSGRVTDEMVEAAQFACGGDKGAYWAPETGEEWRVALSAALAAQGQVTSPAAKVIRAENGSCYIEWAAGANMLDYVGASLYAAPPASPAWVPDQVRFAIERCLRSQEQMAERIEKANPEDPYIAVMIHEDIEIIRQYLAALAAPEGDDHA